MSPHNHVQAHGLESGGLIEVAARGDVEGLGECIEGRGGGDGVTGGGGGDGGGGRLEGGIDVLGGGGGDEGKGADGGEESGGF